MLSGVLGLVALAAAPSEARAFDTDPAPPSNDVRQPMYQPTLGWFAAQLIPSPEVTAGSQGAGWGLRWQITPIAYSWGVYRKISPWRFGVVDPTARQSGSVEFYLAPEYIYYPTHSGSPSWKGDEVMLRWGGRAYFPLWERGEFLSMSVGGSVYDFGGKWATAGELGLYGLGGTAGVQVAVSPTQDAPLRVVTTLVLRFF